MIARGLFVASLLTASMASADEPAPSLKVTVTPAAVGPWTFRIQNTSETPVRVAADARLLSLDVTGADGKALPKCILPDDARPPTDEGAELVIPATRGWSTSFDPIFFCFGAHDRNALLSGATVKAHFGWAAKAPAKAAKGKAPAAASPPFAITPVGASVGKLAPVKEVDADAVTLTDASASKPSPESATPPADEKVYLTLPATMDAAKGADLTATVTLVNESDRAITLMFRPDMVQFGVNGPNGSQTCGSVRSIGSPMRELFVNVPSKGKTALGVMFTATCNGGFDQPGLYRLTARLDTTQASGRSINLRTWDDVAKTRQPMLLRVRQPVRPTQQLHPSLD
jgi:hypothetical protein